MRPEQIADKITRWTLKWWIPQLSAGFFVLASAIYTANQQATHEMLNKIAPLLAGSAAALALLWLGSELRRWHLSQRKWLLGRLWDREGVPYCPQHKCALTTWEFGHGPRDCCPECKHPVLFQNEKDECITLLQASQMAKKLFA